MRTEFVSRVVSAAPEAVYEFARNPDNLPRWAAGLARAEVRRDGEDLLAESPMGTVRVRFARRNDFGVLDHAVTLPDGTVVDNPLRVLAHPDGAETVFAVRQSALTDEEFARDCAAVAADLATLAGLVEEGE